MLYAFCNKKPSLFPSQNNCFLRENTKIFGYVTPPHAQRLNDSMHNLDEVFPN